MGEETGVVMAVEPTPEPLVVHVYRNVENLAERAVSLLLRL